MSSNIDIFYSSRVGPSFSDFPLFNGQQFVVSLTADATLTDNDHAGRLVQDESTTGVTVTLPATLPEGFTCRIFRKATGPNTTIAVARGLILDGTSSLQTGEMAELSRRGNRIESLLIKEVAGSTGRRTAGFFGTFLVVTADTTATVANVDTFYVFEGTPAGPLTFNLPAASTLTVGDFFTVSNNLQGGVYNVNVTPAGSDRIAGQFGDFDVVPQGSTVSYVLRTDASGSGTVWQRVFDGEQATAPDWPESSDSPLTTATTINAGNYADFQNQFVRGDTTVTLPSLSGIPVAQGDGIRFVATTGDFVLTPVAGQTIDGQASLTVTQGQEAVVYRGTSATDWQVFLVAARDVGITQGTTTPVSGVSSWAGLVGAISDSEIITELDSLAILQFTSGSFEGSPAQITGVVTGDFVRFWLRDVLILPGGEGTPGTGIVIAEAQTDEFTQENDQPNGILYMTLPDSFVAMGIDDLRVRVLKPNGTIDQDLPLSDFTVETAFSASGTVYRTSAARRGNAIDYTGGDTIRLFRTTTRTDYTLTSLADLTANVFNLPASKLDSVARARLQAENTVTGPDRDKLNLFASTSTISAETALPDTVDLQILRDVLSEDLDDYEALTPSTGLFPATDGTTKIWYVTVPSNVVITSFSASVSGAASVIEIVPSVLDGRRVYRVDLPSSTDITNVYTPNGTVQDTTRYDVSDLVKISAENFDDALHADFARLHGDTLNAALQDFEAHLSVTFTAGASWTPAPNPPSIRATITRLFAAYFDENRRGAMPFTGNRYDDLANPTETLVGTNYFFTNPNDPTNVRFPGKPSYFTGRYDVVGPPLTNTTPTRLIFALTLYIYDADFTEDVPILKAGTRRIIGLGPTGLHIRQGIQDAAPVTATFDERLRPPGQSNTIQYLQGTGANSIDWFVPATNPAGDTITFPLALTLRPKLIRGGSAGAEATVAYTITDRAVDQAQTSQVVTLDIPGGGTVDETLLLSYTASTNTFTIGTAGLTANGSADVDQVGFEVTYNDSREINDSTQSRDVSLGGQDIHRERELQIVLEIRAENPFETSADKFLEVLGVVNGRQENNIPLHFRASAYDFQDLQWGPNTQDQVAISEIQVVAFDDSGNPANAPTHSELYTLYQNFVLGFGLERPPEQSHRDYTVDGGMILTRVNDTTLNVIDAIDAITVSGSVTTVYAATNNTTGTDGLVSSVTLPADYTDFDLVLVTVRTPGPPVEWRQSPYSVPMLNAGLIDAADAVRLQGNTDLNWNSTTRVLSVAGGAQQISRVELIKV